MTIDWNNLIGWFMGALLAGAGSYFGMWKALAKMETRVSSLEKRTDRLEAPYFEQRRS